MIRLALFGAGGQLGSELIAHAPRHDIALRAFSHSETDIADPHAIDMALAQAKPDIVINAAGYTEVDRAESESEAAFRANAIGPATLGHACAALNLPTVHISTDYVFDGAKIGAYREEDPIAPINVYGSSKAEGEALLRGENPRHLILRTSWMFGIHGRNFLKTVLRQARESDMLQVVTDQFGCPTSTVEVAYAILRLAPALASGTVEWGTYHFAGNGVTSRYEFAREIVAMQAGYTGRQPPVKPIRASDYRSSAERPANCELDCSRFAGAFGFSARPWQERARETVAILCDNGREQR